MTDSSFTLLLTKIAPLFAYPLGLALVLAALGGLLITRWHRQRLGSFCLVIAAIGLWIAAMPVVADWALGSLERQYPPRQLEDIPASDVAILLGGAIGGSVSPRVTADLNAASDRILHAARLFRAGKVQRILVTGGNLPWQAGDRPEALLIRDLLFEWGVPYGAIQVAGASRNTYENALEVRAMRERVPFQSALLVTSAAHMPRAMAVFRHAGLPVWPATTDVEVVTSESITLLAVLPDAGALAMTTAAMKEWLGYWAYRVRGYL